MALTPTHMCMIWFLLTHGIHSELKQMVKQSKYIGLSARPTAENTICMQTHAS